MFLKRHLDRKYHVKFNTYRLYETYGYGYTTNTNQKFYFDLIDYDTIKDYCWNEDNHGYITTRFKINNQDIRYKLHRLIMNVEDSSIEVDHINHDPKNNRRENLRIVNSMQNKQNRSLYKTNTSGVTGVSYIKSANKWRARITYNKKEILLGRFDNFEEAVKARQNAEKEYFGKYRYNVELWRLN